MNIRIYKPLCPLWFRSVLCVPVFFVTQSAQSMHKEHNVIVAAISGLS